MNEPQKFRIQIGEKTIEDLFDPKPEELDLAAICENLKRQIRWASAPGAINVHQHRNLVVRMILDDEHGFEDDTLSQELRARCAEWAYHHDDHEGILGDIVAPVKAVISSRTNVLEIVEVKLDRAICVANHLEYPNEVVRGLVHRYDKAAETLEWVHALGRDLQPWNHHCPAHLMKRGAFYVKWARGL